MKQLPLLLVACFLVLPGISAHVDEGEIGEILPEEKFAMGRSYLLEGPTQEQIVLVIEGVEEGKRCRVRLTERSSWVRLRENKDFERIIVRALQAKGTTCRLAMFSNPHHLRDRTKDLEEACKTSFDECLTAHDLKELKCHGSYAQCREELRDEPGGIAQCEGSYHGCLDVLQDGGKMCEQSFLYCLAGGKNLKEDEEILPLQKCEDDFDGCIDEKHDQQLCEEKYVSCTASLQDRTLSRGTSSSDKPKAQEAACGGCTVEDHCFSYGTRVTKHDIPSYCDASGRLKPQKDEGMPAQEGYECKSNEAGDGACITLLENNQKGGLLRWLLQWLFITKE